ncbi:hypothetical protein Fmac_011965 [Flemingia macrophylla]|uniref:Uncharacterized protein n=1 Tax=Flemingia macrophylla TaxID=520843 RepID=A0ABD1MP00_9FABA
MKFHLFKQLSNIFKGQQILIVLLRFSTVHLHLFSTRVVTHLTVSGYFSGALHDPSDTFSKWPYGGFSWVDHRIIRSISGSYTTVDIPSYSTAGDGNLTVDFLSYSAVGDGNPTVVTKVIPFFSPRIVISYTLNFASAFNIFTRESV